MEKKCPYVFKWVHLSPERMNKDHIFEDEEGILCRECGQELFVNGSGSPKFIPISERILSLTSD